MRIPACIILLISFVCRLPAQQTNVDIVTRQCSAIRELVYAAATSKFETIRGEQLRGSSGYQKQGSWQFSTTRYFTSIAWQGANNSYLEHYEESTDSTRQETWQYIAEYNRIYNVLDAQKLFTELNNEIEGCPYPLNDSTDIAFVPLPPNRLPVDRPSSLEIAKLYELPLPNNSDSTLGAIMVMVGMEKRQKDYRVSLIVENSLK